MTGILQLAQAVALLKAPEAEGARPAPEAMGQAPARNFLEVLFRKLQEGASIAEIPVPSFPQGNLAVIDGAAQDAICVLTQNGAPVADTGDVSRLVPLEGAGAGEGRGEVAMQNIEKTAILEEATLAGPTFLRPEWMRSSKLDEPLLQLADEHALAPAAGLEYKEAEAVITQLRPVNPALLLFRDFSEGDASSGGSLKSLPPPENSLQILPPLTLQEQPSAVIPAENALKLDVDNLLNQLVQGVRLAHHADGSELQVHLKPELLGKLSIKVSSDMHGLRMEIKAENEMVRQIMQDALPDLQQRLAERGVFLNELALLADSGGTSRRKQERMDSSGAVLARHEREKSLELLPGARLPLRLSVIDYLA